MADPSRPIRCTAEDLRTPLPLNNRLPLPNAGDAETLAVFGSQGRRQAHLWKYMLSEVRPHELHTASWAGWTMVDAESIRLVGGMGPPVTSARIHSQIDRSTCRVTATLC